MQYAVMVIVQIYLKIGKRAASKQLFIRWRHSRYHGSSPGSHLNHLTAKGSPITVFLYTVTNFLVGVHRKDENTC